MSPKLIGHAGDAYRRIRNTSRFLLGNLSDFDPAKDEVPVRAMLAIDRWAIATASSMQKQVQDAYRRYEFKQVYQKLLNYCSVDLGALYFDVIKDRLYTLSSKSDARRSAQTTLFHIANALVRWITPILSFTADEIWRAMPGHRNDTAFVQQWHELPDVRIDDVNWPLLLRTRQIAQKALENLRSIGEIGGSLDAEVVVTVLPDVEADFRILAKELRFWLLTSEANLTTAAGNEEIRVVARRSAWIKCSRCRHRRTDVGHAPEFPELCARCITNVTGVGEQRMYF